MTKIFIIDNYDSFTYNLKQLLEEEGAEVHVGRNDCFDPEELKQCDKIVLSPGPGIPDEAGQLKQIIREYAGKKPLLGVCLGHQAIAEVFSGSLKNLSTVYHGIQSPIQHSGNDYLFFGLPETFLAGRYHSWVVEEEDFPSCLDITAVSREGLIMGLQHREYDIHGIQFHPESVLTPMGRTIIQNFVKH